jgi:hypothetical protein
MMFENMSGIKAAIEKETRRVSDFTAAGVYLSMLHKDAFPKLQSLHAAMQPCERAISIFQISFQPIISVVSAANLSSTRDTGQLFF